MNDLRASQGRADGTLSQSPPHSPPRWQVDVLDHRNPTVALQLCGVMQEAQAQEAALLRLHDSAAIVRTPDDIRTSPYFHLGVRSPAGQLLGACSVGADDEPGQLCIQLLVVLPSAQRQGIARALLLAVLQRGPQMGFSVAAAAANAPALALYGSLGFVAYRWGTMGDEQLALVKLRRMPGPDAA